MKNQKLGEHEIVRAARAFADFHREVSGINIKAPRQEMLNSAAGASGWYLYWQQRNGEAPASAEYEETQKEREERQKKARVFLCKVLRKASTEGFNVEALLFFRARKEAQRKRASAWGDRRKAAGKRVVVAYDEGELELVRYRGTVMASVKGGLKVRFDGDDEDQLYLVDADDEWEWEADPGPNDAGATLKESTSTDEAPIDKDDEQDVQDD
jgi:hypothetical protein